MPDGQYLVLWHLCKTIRKKGFFNKLVGETSERFEPVIHSFRTKEVAENVYQNIRKIGGKPSLLKVIK